MGAGSPKRIWNFFQDHFLKIFGRGEMTTFYYNKREDGSYQCPMSGCRDTKLNQLEIEGGKHSQWHVARGESPAIVTRGFVVREEITNKENESGS